MSLVDYLKGKVSDKLDDVFGTYGEQPEEVEEELFYGCVEDEEIPMEEEEISIPEFEVVSSDNAKIYEDLTGESTGKSDSEPTSTLEDMFANIGVKNTNNTSSVTPMQLGAQDYSTILQEECCCRVFGRRVATGEDTISELKKEHMLIRDGAKPLVPYTEAMTVDEDCETKLFVAASEKDSVVYNIYYNRSSKNKVYNAELEAYLSTFVEHANIAVLFYIPYEEWNEWDFESSTNVSLPIVVDKDDVLYYFTIGEYREDLKKKGSVIDLREWMGDEYEQLHSLLKLQLSGSLYANSLKFFVLGDNKCITLNVVNYIEDYKVDELCETIIKINTYMSKEVNYAF